LFIKTQVKISLIWLLQGSNIRIVGFEHLSWLKFI